MSIDLKKYMNERDEKRSRLHKHDGPVVTISREFGCEANRVAQLLIHEINEHHKFISHRQPWKMVSKEVLDEAAKELKITTDVLDKRIMQYHSDSFSDIFSSFSQLYNVSDEKIIEKVREIMHHHAEEGNIILVGRGGAILTNDLAQVLRIRLIAPREWRIRSIAERRKISEKEAEELIRHHDEDRVKWTEHLTGVPFDLSVFDLVINVKTLSDHEIVDLVLHMLKDRGWIDQSVTRVTAETSEAKG
ncbi:AAA family ATPase [Marinoscillum sp. MHG1-6]|uniref:cytidylate kinase-like family protein n=1 Tax=Marinoscillum sp. MHG1-6 TaxID=2959627 RepID=UPI00215802FC|nr:cytidylate kinase-like family protein [Marinoscillum sp. MHG1-6]